MTRSRPSSNLRGPTRLLYLAFTVAVGTAIMVTGCTDDSTIPAPSATSMPLPPEMNIPYGPETRCVNDAPDTCAGSQTLDIYRAHGVTPENPTTGEPRKVALWIHGGGFISGDKTMSLSEYFGGLLDDGWDIVAVNYRLSTPTGNHFPIPLADVKRAVRWVKANAAEQGWNADRVAAIGHSAGGNLAEMLAVTAGRPEFEDQNLPADLEAVDSSVTSVVSMAAVSDLRSFRDSKFIPGAVEAYLGCTGACDAEMAAGSVQTHVTGDAAPILAIHGSEDDLAAPAQGELVAAAYRAAGIGDRFRMIVVADGPVGFRGHVPDMRRWIGDVTEWLNSHTG